MGDWNADAYDDHLDDWYASGTTYGLTKDQWFSVLGNDDDAFDVFTWRLPHPIANWIVPE